jgi:hypothetical protein
MRLAGAFIACLLAIGALPSPARAREDRELRFLGLEPHGPLARVSQGRVRSPEAGACRTWGRKGETWLALDRFGAIVGKARIRGMDRYDVTNCDELDLAVQTGDKGAGLYVSKRYEPLPIVAWAPGSRAARDLAELTKKRDRPLHKPRRLPPSARPAAPRTLFFQTPDGARRAVVGGKALGVYRLEGRRWIVEHELAPEGEGDYAESFSIVGVLDMNGDAAPELVVHWAAIDGYHDLTLSFEPRAKRWRLIDTGIHGAYAEVLRVWRGGLARSAMEPRTRG